VAGGDIAERILQETVFVQERIEVADTGQPTPSQALIQSRHKCTPQGRHGARAARTIVIAAANIHAESGICGASYVRELPAIEIRIAARWGGRRSESRGRRLPIRPIYDVADPATRSAPIPHIPYNLLVIRKKTASAAGENKGA
jgi:hypothetical protein